MRKTRKWNRSLHLPPLNRSGQLNGGLFSVPCRKWKRLQPRPFKLTRPKFGRATEARSVLDSLVPKLTEWAKGLTKSDNWAFIPPDVLNGLVDGDSNNRAHQRVRRWTTASTQFACFLCGNYSHWFLVVADLGSCTMNIFNSAGALGNQLAIKHLRPLPMYMGSFEDSIFGSSWGWETRHADQQQNG
jgi:hypothetical protein